MSKLALRARLSREGTVPSMILCTVGFGDDTYMFYHCLWGRNTDFKKAALVFLSRCLKFLAAVCTKDKPWTNSGHEVCLCLKQLMVQEWCLLSCLRKAQLFQSWLKDGRVEEEGNRKSFWCKCHPVPLGDMRQRVKDSPDRLDESQRRGIE